MRIGGKDSDGLGADVAEVAVVVFAVERLETFAAEYLVELCQRTRTVGAFVQPIGWTHELVDETTEDRRRMTGAVVRFGQHLLQNVSNPTMAS